MTTPPPALDLNADLGEGMQGEDALMGVITSANVACGGHAGDDRSMRAACALAGEHGVHVGAHPSYPDREHFGRRPLDIAGDRLRAHLHGQLAALAAAAATERVPVRYLKPHGALYHRILTDPEHAEAVVDVAGDYGLPLLVSPAAVRAGAAVALAAAQRGVRLVSEGFADRGYLADGTLVPRGAPGAVLHDASAVAARILDLVRTGEIACADGGRLSLAVRSICVHSDTPAAASIARRLRAALAGIGVDLTPFTP